MIIVGNGVAGNSAASAIRKYDRESRITMISHEKYPLYSPCAFHKYLAGEMERQKLFLKRLEDYGKEGISPMFDCRVQAVDTGAKEVWLEDTRLPYDKLILATGSRAVLPPVGGVGKTGVFAPKVMDDMEAIFHYPAERVVVVGSGPIGMEMAAAFRKQGKEVFLIEMLDRILPRLFDERGADILRQTMEDHGIRVFTGETVTEIMGDSSVSGLRTNKRKIECGMVIMAAGMRCNTDLAEKAKIRTGVLRGVATNEYMMTNQTDIYACGDCIEARDMITGETILSLLWSNAKRQGWIAGCNCIGQQKRYNGSINATSLEVFGTHAVSVGQCAASMERNIDYDVIEKSTESKYYRLVIVRNQLAGMQLINTLEHAGQLFSKMLRKDDLVELRRIVFEDKLLSVKPWNYWIGRYMGEMKRINHHKS